MGAGAKCDPSKITIADISDTLEDPLARATRQKLKKVGIERGIPVVFSLERAGPVTLLPLDQSISKEEAREFAPLPDFRSRILPVLGTLPAMFGMAMATYAITSLSEWPHVPKLRVKTAGSVYSKIQKDVFKRLNKR